ncbi:hypothetical protein DEIPH_ctg017orf0219 [Deinococcus phoenicis]|uniref:Uncharacterized protein n=1 Tax=Deinococcus phoenicis TaxID=1476583 RepID=A0A016QS72_9DEIO|nr:hypothetical protein [Deinococcus phoenicis]EYB68841.1 hypothetical protein DEIPH_ctg017orf0219 [Deinococcus phoenicis]
MRFGELKTGAETVTPNWVFDVLGELTLASDMKVLAFLAKHRLYQHSTFKTWEIAGKTGLDVRTVQASTKRLGEAGHIVSAGGEHCLRGACAKPAQPLHKSTRAKTHANPRQEGKKPIPEVKEVREEMEQEQERELSGGIGTAGPRTLSLRVQEDSEKPQTAGGTAGAEAPDGASPGPARPFIVPFQPPANAGNTRPTSLEEVPPGAAGGEPGDSSPTAATRTALEIAFGPVFLAQLLGEGEARPGWLSLEAGRVAELHQRALESSGPRPWRTKLILDLDKEVTQGNAGRGKRRQDLTEEEWMA